MFDVGFSELVVIGLVALVIIGPEKLPKVARTAGILLGRLQRYVNDVKSDISREMQLDEIKHLREQVTSQAHDLETSVTQEMRAVEESLNQTIAPLEDILAKDAMTVLASTSPEASSPPAIASEPGLHAPVKQPEPEPAKSAEQANG